MDTRPLGQAVRFLRQLTPPDGSRLDAELLDRFVAARDEAAFARLVERHGPLVLGVCRRVLGNLHDAEDAFQATFLILAKKARHIRQRHALAGWLYRVAYHLAVRLRAAAGRRTRAERQSAPPPQAPADDRLTWADLRLVLDDEFARLPEKYRAPLLLCCLGGRTRDEAAEELGWTLGTLKMRLERGRQLLKARLDRRGLTVSAAMLAVLLAQQATATPLPAGLAQATARGAVLFAAGRTAAGLSGQTVRLAGLGMSAGVGTLKQVAAAAVLVLLGLAGGVLVTRRPADDPDPGPDPTPTAAPGRPVLHRFAKATEETGLGSLLRRHAARYPEWEPSGATLLDIDGDGWLDLHLAGQAEDFAALGRNTGGRFAYVDPQPHLPRGPRHFGDLPFPGGQVRHAFDFNEDGRLDLAVSWHNDGGTLYQNVAAGPLRFRRTGFIPPEFPDVRSSALADVNRDGVVDFLTTGPRTDVTVYLGKGDGTFRPAAGAVIPTGLQSAGAIPVDLDGDGILELIARQTSHHAPVRRKIFRSVGPMKWVDATRQFGLSGAGSVHGVGDLDQDGRPDLVCLEERRIVLYRNDGHGRFTRRADAVRGLERAHSRPHREWGDSWGGAVVVDFDNDGTPDILINGRFFLYVLKGTGPGAFEYVNDRWGLPDYSYGDVDDGLCFGDIDGDGRLDLVPARDEDGVKNRPLDVFLNRVTDHHSLRVRLLGRPGNAAATGAKVRVTDGGRLVAYEQVAVWGRQSFHSYYAARQTERHFGLGSRSTVDVSVEFYPSGRRVERRNVPADTTVEIIEPGSP